MPTSRRSLACARIEAPKPDCVRCNGEGEVRVDRGFYGNVVGWQVCCDCGGTGWSVRRTKRNSGDWA